MTYEVMMPERSLVALRSSHFIAPRDILSSFCAKQYYSTIIIDLLHSLAQSLGTVLSAHWALGLFLKKNGDM